MGGLETTAPKRMKAQRLESTTTTSNERDARMKTQVKQKGKAIDTSTNTSGKHHTQGKATDIIIMVPRDWRSCQYNILMFEYFPVLRHLATANRMYRALSGFTFLDGFVRFVLFTRGNHPWLNYDAPRCVAHRETQYGCCPDRWQLSRECTSVCRPPTCLPLRLQTLVG